LSISATTIAAIPTSARKKRRFCGRYLHVIWRANLFQPTDEGCFDVHEAPRFKEGIKLAD